MKKSNLIILSAVFLVIMSLILAFLIVKMTHKTSAENSKFQNLLQASIGAAKEGNLSEAIFQAEKAQSLAKNRPETFQARHTLGTLYYNSQLPFKARENLELALNAFPRNPQTYLLLANTYNKLGLYERTISLINNSPLAPEAMDSISLSKEIPKSLRVNVYSILTKAYRGNKDYTNTVKYLKKLKNEGANISDSVIANFRALSLEQEASKEQEIPADSAFNISAEYTPSSNDMRYMDADSPEKTAAKWNGASSKYPEGTIVEGTIINVSSSGLTIRLQESGLKGFVSPNNARWEKTTHLRKYFYPGEVIRAIVLELNEKEQLMSLGIKQLKDKEPEEESNIYDEYSKWKNIAPSLDKPGELSSARETSIANRSENWTQAESRYPKGSIVTGTVVSVSSSGIILRIKGSNLRGHIRTETLPEDLTASSLRDKFLLGTQIQAKVIKVDPDEQVMLLDLNLQSDNIGDVSNDN